MLEAAQVEVDKSVLLLVSVNLESVSVAAIFPSEQRQFWVWIYHHFAPGKKSQMIPSSMRKPVFYTTVYWLILYRREDTRCHEFFPSDFQEMSNYTSITVWFYNAVTSMTCRWAITDKIKALLIENLSVGAGPSSCRRTTDFVWRIWKANSFPDRFHC